MPQDKDLVESIRLPATPRSGKIGSLMRHSPLAIIFLTVFIDLVGFGILLPLLPYYAESFGASATAIGLLSASYSLMQFLFAPIWGRLSDRFGRRPLILISLAGSCVGFLIAGLAKTLALLFVGRIVAGIAGAIIPTTHAYIADVTSPENRAKGMGLVGAAFGLGFIFGPAIGGLLSPLGYDKPILLASVMAGLNFVFAFFLLPESLSNQVRCRVGDRGLTIGKLAEALSHPQVGLLLLIFFMATFAFSNMEATFALLNEHAYDLTAKQTGYLFVYIGVVMSVMQGLLVGKIVKRLGEKLCITLGTFALIFGLGLLPFAPNMVYYCAINGVLALGTGINNPSVNALISRSAGADEQGGIMGIAQSMASMARILGPLWGGYSFGELGHVWPFLSAGLLMALAFFMSLKNLASRFAVSGER
jgi:MFS transporter, DHA1 family, tetracycline resistance protein